MFVTATPLTSAKGGATTLTTSSMEGQLSNAPQQTLAGYIGGKGFEYMYKDIRRIMNARSSYTAMK